MEEKFKINIEKVPFTYPGSFFTIFHYEPDECFGKGIYIKTLHKEVWRDVVLKIEYFIEEEGLAEVIATPTELILKIGSSKAGICFENDKTIRVIGDRGKFKLSFVKASHVILRKDSWMVNCAAQNEKALLTSLSGQIKMDYDWDGDNCTYVMAEFAGLEEEKSFEGVVEFFRDVGVCEERNYNSYEEVKRNTDNLYKAWRSKRKEVQKKYEKASELADYINWSSVVNPYKNITRRTMYASKSWMNGIWSWDHCFHAIAAAQRDQELAWDQFMLMFDKQDAYGALPDMFHEIHVNWTGLKPPVHGFMLSYLMEHYDFVTTEMLKEAYQPLVKWTDFWINHRKGYEGMPEYYNGNDSGWDNNTVSFEGVSYQSPDLITYLILQMDTLSLIADKLGLQEEKEEWKSKAEDLLSKLLKLYWVDNKFVGRMGKDLKIVDSKSLILYIPLLLGERLPQNIRETMIKELKEENKFLTPFGLASERIDSIHYEADGYWRGPIWAPSTFMITQGLMKCGEKEFAEDIMKRFCDMVAASETMSENYNALTGMPLRDPTIVWTSCVFMVLLENYM